MSAIAEHGLLVSGPGGQIRVSVRSHTTPPREPVDLVVLAVKAADGAVPREAAKAGREAPVNATLTALVRARETSWEHRPPA